MSQSGSRDPLRARDASWGADTELETDVSQSTTEKRHLIAYPFPLADGLMAKLQLPADGLRKDEADRLREFVDSLTLDIVVTLSRRSRT